MNIWEVNTVYCAATIRGHVVKCDMLASPRTMDAFCCPQAMTMVSG